MEIAVMINLGPKGPPSRVAGWNRPAEFTGSYRVLLLSATFRRERYSLTLNSMSGLWVGSRMDFLQSNIGLLISH